MKRFYKRKGLALMGLFLLLLLITGAGKASSVKAAKTAAPAVSVQTIDWDSVKVSWKGVSNAAGYRIYIKTDSGWKKQGDYKSTTRWVIIRNLEFNKKHTFTVRAYAASNSGKVWGDYNKTGVSAVTALNQPVLGKAVAASDGLKVTWTAVNGAEGYRIYRKGTSSGSEWKRIAQISGQSQSRYVDRTAAKGKTYRYTVRAYRKAGKKIVLSTYDKKGISGSMKSSAANDGIDPDQPMIALTYDDGPSVSTPKILDILEKYDARATFFVVGDRVDGNSNYQSYVKRACKLNCQIGNHTYSHATLTRLSQADIRSQISKCDNAVKKAAGVTPAVMRPPGGNRNATVDQTVGKPLILWSVDTEDWKTRNASSTISAVLDHVKDGDIVLMHDLYSSTAEASETIIPELIRRGYQLVTVEELAQYRGGMKAGQRYSSFRAK
ncbi:MAG: polysaccharide deacetylase family protein [Lachnospiraceae bacterium]